VGDTFLMFMILLFVMAALVRDDYVFHILYLFLGASLAGRWWSRRALRGVGLQRVVDQRAFPGETVPVRLRIENPSWLPVVWLRIQENLPLEISEHGSFHQVISLGPRSRAELAYELKPHQRGYYPVGPLKLYSGDVLGIASQTQRAEPAEHLIVYPRVLPLGDPGLPSRSPQGTLRHTQPIFEDPTRPVGKRDYQAGDSLRRVDWKATAITGRLQVKQFEPAIDLQTAILLDLNSEDYYARSRYDAPELAIVLAASIANWAIQHRQAAGLWTNGLDPLDEAKSPPTVLPRKGQANLMRILEILARVSPRPAASYIELIAQSHLHLGWGATLVLITGSASDELFDEMLRARRAGMSLLLALCGTVSGYRGIQERARRFGIPAYHFERERDLEIWRR
jgi:uncharacterized protein (DUF58 family)